MPLLDGDMHGGIATALDFRPKIGAGFKQHFHRGMFALLAAMPAKPAASRKCPCFNAGCIADMP